MDFARVRRAATAVVVRSFGRTDRPDMVRLGSQYGGWWVPHAILRDGAVCFCIGAGEDVTFDIALHAHGCEVVVADPTPRAVTHVMSVAPAERFRFEAVGVAGRSEIRRFYAPSNPAHVSHSMANLQGTSAYFDAECLSLADLMQRIGVDAIDLLKLDVEGAEHEILDDMVRSGLRPEVVAVEFDDARPLRVARQFWRLRRAGYSTGRTEKRNTTFVLAT